MKSPERVSDLIEKDLPPVISWVGEGILGKRNVMLLGGPQKIGKSWYNLEFARALSVGDNVFGHPQFHTTPCRVLYVEQEIGEMQLQKRVRKVMGKEDPEVYGDRLWYMSQTPEMKLDNTGGRQVLIKALEATQANVCLLDPVKNLHNFDENSNTDIQRLFDIFQSLISMFVHNDLSLIISHHARKPPTDTRIHYDALDPQNFRGANNWISAPDSIMTIHRNRELQTPYTAWENTNRLLLRNDGGIKDWRMTINRDNDLKVKFDSEMGGGLAPLAKPEPKEAPQPPPVTLTGVQGKLGFTGA